MYAGAKMCWHYTTKLVEKFFFFKIGFLSSYILYYSLFINSPVFSCQTHRSVNFFFLGRLLKLLSNQIWKTRTQCHAFYRQWKCIFRNAYCWTSILNQLSLIQFRFIYVAPTAVPSLYANNRNITEIFFLREKMQYIKYYLQF